MKSITDCHGLNEMIGNNPKGDIYDQQYDRIRTR